MHLLRWIIFSIIHYLFYESASHCVLVIRELSVNQHDVFISTMKIVNSYSGTNNHFNFIVGLVHIIPPSHSLSV